MSTFDDYALQRRQEAAQKTAQKTAQTTDDPSRDAPYPVGGFLGFCAIIVSTLLLIPTGGVSAIGYVAAGMSFAGRRVEKKAQAAMWEASDRGDQAAINRAATAGCFEIGCLGIVTLLIAAGFFCMLWGITL